MSSVRRGFLNNHRFSNRRLCLAASQAANYGALNQKNYNCIVLMERRNVKYKREEVESVEIVKLDVEGVFESDETAKLSVEGVVKSVATLAAKFDPPFDELGVTASSAAGRQISSAANNTRTLPPNSVSSSSQSISVPSFSRTIRRQVNRSFAEAAHKY
jgi:hypothetical protein